MTHFTFLASEGRISYTPSIELDEQLKNITFLFRKFWSLFDYVMHGHIYQALLSRAGELGNEASMITLSRSHTKNQPYTG